MIHLGIFMLTLSLVVAFVLQNNTKYTPIHKGWINLRNKEELLGIALGGLGAFLFFELFFWSLYFIIGGYIKLLISTL